MNKPFLPIILCRGLVMSSLAQTPFESDVLPTSAGSLTVTFIGHGTLMMQFDTTLIHIDPVSGYADYAQMPKADIVLITHAHGDHLDATALQHIVTPNTTIIAAPVCQQALNNADILLNGQKKQLRGIEIEAVPAYNIVHKRPGNVPYHPKGEGNGYILRHGGKAIYVAGDTENTPEMKALQGIDIAFLPMNLPYTMTPEMVADAARALRPVILYPYHYGKTDVRELEKLLEKDTTIEIRIRDLQ